MKSAAVMADVDIMKVLKPLKCSALTDPADRCSLEQVSR